VCADVNSHHGLVGEEKLHDVGPVVPGREMEGGVPAHNTHTYKHRKYYQVMFEYTHV